MKYELQNIISGTSKVKFGKLIQAAASHLKRSKGTSALVENDKQIKSTEIKSLKVFIEENSQKFVYQKSRPLDLLPR